MIVNAVQPKSKAKQRWPRIQKVAHRNGTTAWLVDARIRGKGERLFFKTKAEADTKADELRIRKMNEGVNGFDLPDSIRAEAKTCVAKLAEVGATISEATEFFLKHAKPTHGKKTISVVIEEFLRVKAQAGRKPSYLSVQKYVLDSVFGGRFGKRMVHEVTHCEIEAWMMSKDWSLRTRENYYCDLSNFFGFAVKRGYCASNPVAKLEKPTVTTVPPGILTVNQASDMLNAAEQLDGGAMLPAVAIGLFAGLRSAEIERLEWRHVKLNAKTIEVTAANAKTRERRIVDICDTLANWLRPYANAQGHVAPQKSFDWRLKKCWQTAKIEKWPHNACRHSFASYHLAYHKNAALTASQIGHFESTRTLINCYRELVGPSEAAEYWALAPTASSKVVSISEQL